MSEDTHSNEVNKKTKPPGFGLGIALAAGFFVLFMMLGLGGFIGGALAGGLGMGIGMLVGKAFSSKAGNS